jgi:Tfp pilus assembly protein PilO
MNKDAIVTILLLLLVAGFYFFYAEIVARQPDQLKKYDYKIEENKQRLLSAQILAKNLYGVSGLITENIADSPEDSLAQGASLKFLRYITNTLDGLDIKLVSLRPADPVNEGQGYIRIPYEVEVLASYNQFGKFIAELEKSSRIIVITSFHLNNHIGRGHYIDLEAKPDQRSIYIAFEVITLLRKGAIVETS